MDVDQASVAPTFFCESFERVIGRSKNLNLPDVLHEAFVLLDRSYDNIVFRNVDMDGMEGFSVEQASNDVCRCVKSEGYECLKTFKLELSLPAALAARQRCMHEAQGTHLDGFQDARDKLREELVRGLEDALGIKEEKNSEFHLRIHVRNASLEQEIKNLLPKIKEKKRKRGMIMREKREKEKIVFCTDAVKQAIFQLPAGVFDKLYQRPRIETHSPFTIDCQCYRLPIYVAGYYRKLDRCLSQSPWFIDGRRVGSGSVEETITHKLMELYGARGHKFLSAGREDKDVRMLGLGRPFIVELVNAKKAHCSRDELGAVENEIKLSRSGVEVNKLQQVSKELCRVLKEGEEGKQKVYKCVIWLSRVLLPAEIERINQLTDVHLQQQTPVRVLHRRTPMIRERTVHSMQCVPVSGCPHYYTLELRTQAGTYVKEFIHGDWGRTEPSFGDLTHCQAEILQLDVTSIEMDFLP